MQASNVYLYTSTKGPRGSLVDHGMGMWIIWDFRKTTDEMQFVARAPGAGE